MSEFFNMDGQPISVEEWGRLYEDLPARTIALDAVKPPVGDQVFLHTVWVGLRGLIHQDHIFGTAVIISAKQIRELSTWPTKEEALAGHHAILQRLQSGELAASGEDSDL